jgi:hypothetical protein
MAVFKFPDNRAVTQPSGNRTFSGEPEDAFSSQWHKFFVTLFRRLGGMDGVTAISTADIAAAGGAYSQAHTDTIVALLNEVKAKQNEILEILQR